MNTPGVAEAATLLRDLEFVDPSWEGRAFVPSWDRELQVSIRPGDEGITPRQLTVLRAVLGYLQQLRSEFEWALFAYYRADVEGSYCSYDEHGRPIPGSGPPSLSEPSQVWGLIDEPAVCIPSYFRTPSAVEFELSFNCMWDEQLGYCIEIGTP